MRFHATKIEKTGYNYYAKYPYFELSDFLVPALKIFSDLKLSAYVSFMPDIATMTITDLEDNSSFTITSPMSTAELKATHAVQQLGAVQTYLRRYLWVAALEIVEHDAIDSAEGPQEKKTDDKAMQEWRDGWIAYIQEASNADDLKARLEAAIAGAKEANDKAAAQQFRKVAEELNKEFTQ